MFKFVRKGYNHIKVENDLTPLEVKERLGKLASLRSDFQIAAHLRREPPKRFLRWPVTEDVTHYRAVPSADTLIAVFNGRFRRPMVPISVFLQMLDDERFGVLLLTDREKNHFENGIFGYAESLPQLAAKLARFAEAEGYGSILTLGTSMGGLAALRAGRLLDATRAISIGGRFAWHIGRLAGTETARPIPAFDLLCGCVASETLCINLFGEHNSDDVRHAAALSRMLPSSRAIAVPIAEHNPINRCFELGRLDAFYRELFSPAEPDAATLRRLFQTAQPEARIAAR